MQQSPSIGALAAALAKAQGKFGVPKKAHLAKVFSKRTNSTFTYNYASMPEFIEATKDALADNGIAVVQDVRSPDDLNISVTTTLLHESGEWKEFGPLTMPGGTTPQDDGIAVAYLCRYALAAVLRVAAVEDSSDGNITTRTEGKHEKGASRPKAAEQEPAANDRDAMPPEDDGGPVTVTKITPKPGLKDGELFYVVEFSDHRVGWTTDEALAKAAIDAADAHDYVVPALVPHTGKSGKKSLKLTGLEVA